MSGGVDERWTARSLPSPSVSAPARSVRGGGRGKIEKDTGEAGQQIDGPWGRGAATAEFQVDEAGTVGSGTALQQ